MMAGISVILTVLIYSLRQISKIAQMKCITTAWDQHENELRNFLRSRVADPVLAEDLLQDVFVKALANRSDFCELENSRAWLFKVTRNRLIDYRRTHKEHSEIEDVHPTPSPEDAPVINLSKCLPTALKGLSAKDKDIIEQCDLGGVNQAEYAKRHSMTLVAVKSRIQRARKRLKTELHTACNIILDDNGNVCCFDPQCK